MVVFTCEFQDCEWQSEDYAAEISVKLLELHVKAKHDNPTQSSAAAGPRLEKAKRPEIVSDMSEEDWAYFISRWDDYKKVMSRY